MLKKTLLLFACLFTIRAFTQNLSITNAGGPSSVTGCFSSGNFTFKVNNTNNFTASDVVHLDFMFAQGIQLNQVTSNAGTIGIVGNSITVSNLNGINTFDVQYSIRLNCNFPSNTVFNTHTVNYQLNANGFQTFNYSLPYACTQSVIVFDGGTNLNYNNALLNVPFTRTYIFKNSSAVPFSGSFAFDDNTYYTANSTFHFANISSPSSGNITITGSALTASNAHIELQVTNLQQGESFQITEEGYLAECSGALDLSKTVFTAKFGCNANDLCKDVESSMAKEALARVSQQMPDVQFTNDLHLESCINSATHKTYTITNIGSGAANKAALTFAPGGFGPLLSGSYFLDNIDQNSISATINGVQAPASYSTTASGYYAYINVIGNIEPGQSVVIEYDEVFNCIPEAGYDDYFNKTAILHSFHPIYASLSHPCLGDDVFEPGKFYSHPQELLQTFTNLNGQMLGGPPSSAWFSIDNATPLTLGNYLQPFNGNLSGAYLVPYNLADAEFEVKLLLETGLKLTANSDFYLTSQVGSTIYTLNPLPGDVTNPNTGQGDIVTAKFHFPSNWYAPYTYNGHTYWATTTEFNQFFSSFKVNFQLEANCANAPSNGVAHITEECFINPTPACTNCKIPLCKVSDFTNINCPGCVVPGWNITSFDIKRVNIGFADTDNNHLLDSHPPSIASANTINTSAAMIGDIIEGSITGYLSDGQDFGLDLQGNPVPVGFTFNNAGFNYSQGLLNFSGSVLQHLVFIGATGNLTLSNGAQTSFIINAADILPQSVCIGIPMSIQDLTNYGAQGLSTYSTITNIELHPQFKIIHNLTDGNGNPYYSPRAINCFYYIGGHVFNDPCTNLPDANYHIPDLLAQPGTRPDYQYWCTSFEGRFMGTGVDLKKTYLKAAENTHYNSIPSISLCSKSISYNYWVSAGKAYTADPQSGPMNQTSANIFYNEIRSIGTLEELTFNFPPDYEPDKITFHNFDAGYDLSNNVHTWYYDVNHNFDYPVYDNSGNPTSEVSMGTNSITIYPSHFISTLPLQPPYATPYYSAFEENQYYVVSMYLKPKNCSALPGLSDFNNNTVQTEFSNYPLNTVTQTNSSNENVDVSNLKNNLSFRNPNPVLTLTAPSGINANNNLVSWDVALTTNAVAPSPEPLDEAIIRSAENTYVSFVSPSGNFSNMAIGGNLTTFYNSASLQTPPVTIAGWTTDFANQSQGYALDFIGYNYNEGQLISKQFKINADFNCADLSPGDLDYITVYKGWNCFNSPTSVLSACKHDSVNLYFTVPQTEVQVSFQHETTVSPCSTINAGITFDPIIGVTQSALVELQSNPAGAYNYVAGSAYFTTDDGNGNITTTYIEPAFTGGTWTWNINLPGGIFSQPAVLHYQLQASCGFDSGQTIQHVAAKNSCGLVITNLTDTWNPQIISNLPEPDLIEVNVNDINLTNCQNMYPIQVTISNTGNNVTSGHDYLIFPLPSGIGYTGTNPGITLLNNELHITVPANINPGNNFTYNIPVSCAASTCTTIPLEFSIIHNIVYTCGNETCATSSGPVLLETSSIHINLPVYTVSNINTEELCNSGNTLYFSLDSSTPGINEITAVSIIDLNTGNVLGSTATLLPFINSQSMSVILNGVPGNNLGFLFTGCNCNSIIEYSYTCPPCNANAGADLTICQGETATLNAGNGNSYLWMPGNFNTQAINVNPQQTTTYVLTLNGNPACTDEATVFVNPVPQIIVTGQDSVCKGQNSTLLTANALPAGGDFIWTIPPSNTPLSTSNILTTGLLGSTTVFAVSSTLNGCTSSTTYPVTVVGDINVSLTASSTELCAGDNLILTANGAGFNGTYSWDPQPLSVNANGSQATYAPVQTMAYTVMGTNSIGCQSENSITVEVRNCLCDGKNVPTTIGPHMQTVFSGSAFAINNTTNINVNTTFEDASVVFTGAYTVFVNNGATLTLNHAHLWACETMWNGIKVLPGGKLVITGNSLIEDADSAICIHNPVYAGAGNTILNIDAATFNKNFTAVTIDNYNSSDPEYPFHIKDAVFSKRAIGFVTTPPFTAAANPWPGTSSYKTITDPGTINEHCAISDDYLSTDLKSPHVPDNVKYGIRLSNIGNLNNDWNAVSPVYSGIFIGGIDGHGKNNMNLYDNLETGIYAVSSNFTNINSTFQYMVSVTPEPTINTADGTGIFAFKAKWSDNMYKASIKEGFLFQTPLLINKFYDNRCGVLITNYAVTEITNSDVRSTQANAPGTPGAIGFEVLTVKYKSVSVISNTITNVSNAIRFTGYQNSVFGPAAIDNNMIQAHYPNVSFLPGQFVRQGIFAETYSILNPVQSNTIVSTSNNILLDVDNGIVTAHWKALRSVSKNNYIRMVYRSGNLPNQIGIAHSDNSLNEINSNTIEDDPGSNVLYSVEGYKGIYSNSCLKENVTCNTVTKLGRGIEFENDHSGSAVFANNTFNNNFKGYVLSNPGNIGDQATLTSPSDNKWYNFQPSSFHTFVYSPDPSSSKLYVRAGLPYQPTQNGAASGSTAYIFNTSLFNITNNPKQLLCKPAVPFNGNRIAMCDTCEYSDPGNQSRFNYFVYPNPAQHVVYISTNDFDIRDAWVDVTDITGKHILSKEMHFEKGAGKFDLNIENGAYLLTIQNEKGVKLSSHKLIIMK